MQVHYPQVYTDMTRFAYSLMAKRFSMKLRSKVAAALALFLFSFVLLSCSPMTAEPEKATAEAAKVAPRDMTPPSLPVQYQQPSYQVGATGKDDLESQADDTVIKVGARISSKTKVALKDIMKPLATLKKLNISWASDVVQDALVDVDIQANDDFYKAIDNLLRQLDYFYEIEESTIVIKYRETKQFHIAMPFTKQDFSTGTGGNVLGGDVGGEGIAKNIEGTIKLTSEKNEFDTWKNVTSNLESILKIERTKKTTTLKADNTTANATDTPAATPNTPMAQVVEEVTGGQESYYFIDKPVGLITVTAPRPILDKIEAYITSLKKELYKQISIEAKIIEVILMDNSSIGINWTSVLKNFQVTGQVGFGDSGSVWSWNPLTGTADTPHLVSEININTAPFDLFLNALKTQGNTKVLSNPKISVMNGQPAMITVGQNITYIDKIEVDVDGTTGTRTFTSSTANVLSGVGLGLTATVLNNNEIIMNLIPVTSELEGEILYKQVGEGEVGLPIINVREMSTTVRVKDGEMLVIGGLISDMNSEEGNFAPVVGDIPLVKYLFGHEEKVKNKRELIILLKPRII